MGVQSQDEETSIKILDPSIQASGRYDVRGIGDIPDTGVTLALHKCLLLDPVRHQQAPPPPAVFLHSRYCIASRLEVRVSIPPTSLMRPSPSGVTPC